MSDRVHYSSTTDGGDQKLIFKPLSPCTASLSSVIQKHLKAHCEQRIIDIYFDLSAAKHEARGTAIVTRRRPGRLGGQAM